MRQYIQISDELLTFSAAGKYHKNKKGGFIKQSVKQVVKQTVVTRNEFLSRNKLAVGVNLGVNLANSGNLVNVPVGANNQSAAAGQINFQYTRID